MQSCFYYESLGDNAIVKYSSKFSMSCFRISFTVVSSVLAKPPYNANQIV